MMKKILLTFFIFPLITITFISCASDESGSFYTGSSISSEQSSNNEEEVVVEENIDSEPIKEAPVIKIEETPPQEQIIEQNPYFSDEEEDYK